MNKEKTIILIYKLSVPEILPIYTMSEQMAPSESFNYPKSHTEWQTRLWNKFYPTLYFNPRLNSKVKEKKISSKDLKNISKISSEYEELNSLIHNFPIFILSCFIY